MRGIRVIGLGHALGSKKVLNSDLETTVHLSSHEIERKTGIRTRYRCEVGKENLYVLFASAIQQALVSAHLPLDALNGIFVSSNPTGEYAAPNTGTIVASLLGVQKFYNWHGGAGCTGGIAAIEAAYNKLKVDSERGVVAYYAVAAGDQTSEIVKKGSTDEMLFSDAAGCLILTNEAIPCLYEIDYVQSETQVEGARHLRMKRKEGVLEHDGKAVFKWAVNVMPTACRLLGEETFPSNTYLIPHQANKRIIEQLSKGIDPRLVYSQGISQYGNTSGASVILGLEEYTRTGQNLAPFVVLLAFGEGLTVGVVYMTRKTGHLFERVSSEALREEYMRRYQALWQ